MWKKGESGNPKGRPKRDLVTAHLERALLALDGTTDATNARRIAEKAIELAKQGHPWAVQFVTERTEGKPDQHVSISSSVAELTDDDLRNIASGGRDGTAEAQVSAALTAKLH